MVCVGVSLTCHMPAATLQVPSRTNSTCLFTVMVVAVNVAVHPSSHSCPMYISDPGWRWGNIWAVLDLVDSIGLWLSSALWVACGFHLER